MKKSINPVWGGRFKNENSELLKKLIIQYRLIMN